MVYVCVFSRYWDVNVELLIGNIQQWDFVVIKRYGRCGGWVQGIMRLNVELLLEICNSWSWGLIILYQKIMCEDRGY
jgi:hypothetical protein